MSIFDTNLKALGVNFLARPLTSKLKIFLKIFNFNFKIEDFLKIFNFEVNGLAKKSTPNAFKSLSNMIKFYRKYI